METQWVPWALSAALLVVNIIQFRQGQANQAPALRLIGSGSEVRQGEVFVPRPDHSYWYLQNTGQGTAHNIFLHIPHPEGVKQIHTPDLATGDIAWLKDWPSKNTYVDYMDGKANRQPTIVKIAYRNDRMRSYEKQISLPGDSYKHITLETQLSRVVGERPPLQLW